jgi:small subunit ribosomal protein S3
MGQKVNPIGIRVGINRTWDSRWFSDRNYADRLVADLKLRDYVTDKLKAAGISKVIIERAAQNTRVTVHTARPGVIIGKKGADIEKLRKDLSDRAGGEVALNIVEIRKPEMDAQLVAEGVAQQLERRVSFRRAMKRAVQSALRQGALGVRICVAGRLGGADIARSEWYREGRVPLHTLRADLDYGFSEAETTFGIIGVKVWIYKGDVLEHDPMARDKRMGDGGGSGPRG